MLRVGLTGDLGSGKSTVARLLEACGATVLSSDEIARAMMEPGEKVYREIVERFGPGVLDKNGRLDRAELARLAFDPGHLRVEELNSIVHPAVLAEQERQIGRIAKETPEAIVVIESALIFSVRIEAPAAADSEQAAGEPWRKRFDCVVVVTAPREVKIARFVDRAAAGQVLSDSLRERLRADASRRLDMQAQTAVPEDETVLRLPNDGDLAQLQARVLDLWEVLGQRARSPVRGAGL